MMENYVREGRGGGLLPELFVYILAILETENLDSYYDFVFNVQFFFELKNKDPYMLLGSTHILHIISSLLIWRDISFIFL